MLIHRVIALMVLLGSGLMGCQPPERAVLQPQAESQQLPDAATLSDIETHKEKYVRARLQQQALLQAQHTASHLADSSDPVSTALVQNSALGTPITAAPTSQANALESQEQVSDLLTETASRPDNETIFARDQSQDQGILQSDPNEVSVPLPLADQSVLIEDELSAQEIEQRFNDAIFALLQADDYPLSAPQMQTLISMATLVPELFRNPSLAQRLTQKAPELALLIKQYQTWAQIEAQLAEELEQVKTELIEQKTVQGAEFEKLMAEFNKTIQSYDEKIAQYEALLADFER